jgi:hypothetical protein
LTEKTAIRFNDITNVHRFLGRVANELYNENLSVDRAKALGYLCSIMIKSIEIKDVEKRLIDIEKLIEDREIK